MPPIVYLGIRYLHIVSMALWFATPLLVTGDLRRTIAKGKPHTDAVVARVDRALSVAAVGAILTIVSGFGMVFALGGFKAVSPRIHASILVALITLGIEFFVLKQSVARLGGSLEGDSAKDVQPMLSKISMIAGITHLLKAVILGLMIYK